MTKGEFWEKIKNMGHPVLSEEDYSDWPFLSLSLKIQDRDSSHDRFFLPVVRMSRKEWLSDDYDDYYKREDKAKRKYERWLYEFCGVIAHLN